MTWRHILANAAGATVTAGLTEAFVSAAKVPGIVIKQRSLGALPRSFLPWRTATAAPTGRGYGLAARPAPCKSWSERCVSMDGKA